MASANRMKLSARESNAMSVAYAPKGLLGVFTPQANTTVEPEIALLTPPGYAWINARMVSGKDSITARLLDYMDQFPEPLAQFANAPITAIAIACTGASYLIGKDREDALIADIETRAGVPAFTGATASVDALRTLGAKRIGLVSPYNSALDAESAGYWESRGFTVAAEASAYRESSDFHPIYSLDAMAAERAVKSLDGQDIDAVLMLGTGMPTLDAIAHVPFIGRAPVLSCMLCVGWKAIALRDPGMATRDGLISWVGGEGWSERLARSRAFT
ncbi:Maleate isomerase [Hyphomicrobiales bacterium]|nr:Maleate isomerase [Hyphomicrobiales bacterium]CAH1692171.1 Maleate isomerase [Hyphomicrobiales bacterium]